MLNQHQSCLQCGRNWREGNVDTSLIYSNGSGDIKNERPLTAHHLDKSKEITKELWFEVFFPFHISEKGVKSGDFYHLFPSKKSICFIAVKFCYHRFSTVQSHQGTCVSFTCKTWGNCNSKCSQAQEPGIRNQETRSLSPTRNYYLQTVSKTRCNTMSHENW